MLLSAKIRLTLIIQLNTGTDRKTPSSILVPSVMGHSVVATPHSGLQMTISQTTCRKRKTHWVFNYVVDLVEFLPSERTATVLFRLVSSAFESLIGRSIFSSVGNKIIESPNFKFTWPQITQY